MDESVWFWKPEKERLIDRWVVPPKYKQLTRDLIWTIRAQIQGKSFAEIAEKGKIEDSKKYVDEVISYSRLKKHHFDITEINRSTVKKALTGFFQFLNFSRGKD